MPTRVLMLWLFLSGFTQLEGYSQTIVGQVLDLDTKRALREVSIDNIYTGLSFLSDSEGKFIVPASKGQLLEFKKIGYKTVRVRIPDGYVPSYFKIIIEKGLAEVPPYNPLAAHDYRSDSIYFHNLYKHELEFPKMSDLDKIQHPFSALSKRSQEIWSFQKDFDENQQEKYIDYTFNPQLVSSLTGLTGDSLNFYMRRYRPSYQQLRSMNEYNFFNYIKRTVFRYREIANTPHRNSQ